MSKLELYKGLYFPVNTPIMVREVVLEQVDINASKSRLRFFYGNLRTGESWNAIHDTQGYVSKREGDRPVAILVSKRSSLKGVELPGNVVRITRDKEVLYTHPRFNIGSIWVRHLPDDTYQIMQDIRENSKVQVDGLTRKQAYKWIAYLKGERNKL